MYVLTKAAGTNSQRMHLYITTLITIGCLLSACSGSNLHIMSAQNSNPLLCDIETGLCELPGQTAAQAVGTQVSPDKTLRIVYFTDPICSSCWGIEPQLRKLKLAYGHALDIEYRMGGLLPDWSYNSGGISKPSDVAHHWDEVSLYYDMPIDGDVWLEDPLHSSYPPSIAFKAAQLQDEGKAILFLRLMREQVFLQKKNITRQEVLAVAAREAGLDPEQLQADMQGRAKQAFEEDLAMARQWGVRGFPTIFILSPEGQRELVYGAKPYAAYVTAMSRLLPELQPRPYDTDWQSLFEHYNSLTAKEYATLSETDRNVAAQQLEQLSKQGKLRMFSTKNGHIWYLNQP